MSETNILVSDIRSWAMILGIALERGDKTKAIDAIKEIEDMISRICYVYDLFVEVPTKKK